MPAGEPLRSTFWHPDHDDPDRAARRAEERAYLEAVRDYDRAVMAGPPAPVCGMTIAPHPHDHPPTPPIPPDATDRERHIYGTSPMVAPTVHCSHPGCDRYDIVPMREDTYRRLMAAGGFRCQDHPHEPELLEDRERHLANASPGTHSELDHSPASKAAAQVNEGGPRLPTAAMAAAGPGVKPTNRDDETHGPADDLPRRTQGPAPADRPHDQGGRPAGGRTCERCGTPLAGARTDALYCSNACRQAVHRRRRRNAQP